MTYHCFLSVLLRTFILPSPIVQSTQLNSGLHLFFLHAFCLFCRIACLRVIQGCMFPSFLVLSLLSQIQVKLQEPHNCRYLLCCFFFFFYPSFTLKQKSAGLSMELNNISVWIPSWHLCSEPSSSPGNELSWLWKSKNQLRSTSAIVHSHPWDHVTDVLKNKSCVIWWSIISSFIGNILNTSEIFK